MWEFCLTYLFIDTANVWKCSSFRKSYTAWWGPGCLPLESTWTRTPTSISEGTVCVFIHSFILSGLGLPLDLLHGCGLRCLAISPSVSWPLCCLLLQVRAHQLVLPPCEVVIKAVAEYVSSIKDLGNLDAIARDVFKQSQVSHVSTDVFHWVIPHVLIFSLLVVRNN